MHLTASRAAVATALAAGLLVATSASAETAPSETRLFLGAEGCGAEQQPGTLSATQTVSSSTGCGTIGGLPIDGVFYELDAATPTDYSTRAGDGVPVVLDDARDVTGVFATQSWTGGVGAVGDVSVDLVLTARYLDATNRARTLTLGSGTFTQAGSPASVVTSVPFTFDVPDAAAGLTFTAVNLSATVHGINLNGSAQSYDGTSYLDLPTLVETAAE